MAIDSRLTDERADRQRQEPGIRLAAGGQPGDDPAAGRRLLAQRDEPRGVLPGGPEDEFLEWATVWAFAAAAVVFAVAAIRQRRSGVALPWFLAGVSLFCIFVAGEEISWGQRVFGYRPPAYFLATPRYDKEVSAGSIGLEGNEWISAQLVDDYDNAVTQSGITAYLSVETVVGSTGTIKSEDPPSTFNDLGTSTSSLTDANGMVGITPPLWYFVSNKKGDSARVWIGTFTAPAYFDKLTRLYSWMRLADYPVTIVLGLSENAVLKPIEESNSKDRRHAVDA